MRTLFYFFAIVFVFGLTSPLTRTAEELPPPKMETPEYLEARKTLLANLHPEDHAPALRIWHRMIDFMVEVGSGRCSPADIRYRFDQSVLKNYSRLEAEEKKLYRFAPNSYFGTDWVTMDLFHISDKHVVAIDLRLEWWHCGCCNTDYYPEYDKELIADIAKFSKLQILHATSPGRLHSDGLKEIEHFESLVFWDVVLDEEMFQALGKLTNVRELVLGCDYMPGYSFNRNSFAGPWFDASYFALLAPLQNLRKLTVISHTATIQTFPHLAGLEELRLEVAEINDEAFVQIKKLPNIKKIQITRSYFKKNEGEQEQTELVRETILQWEKL